jgi:hypothetical protein
MPEFFFYYSFPLESDDYHYIWAADNMMTFEYDVEVPENMRKITDILNGYVVKVLPNVTLDYPDIKINGETLMTARGLDHLVFRKGLEEGKALEIQKQFLDYCVKRLSGKS